MILPFLSRGLSFVALINPNAFSFTTQNGFQPGVTATSNVVQITGINVPVTGTISNGATTCQLRVATDAAMTNIVQNWATSVTVQPGQYVQASQVSTSYNASVTATITIGLGSATWTVASATESAGSTGLLGAGTYNPTTPNYNSLTVELWGPGGGGAAFNAGGDGGASVYYTPGGNLIAYGGGGGRPMYSDPETGMQQGTPGANGGASGGDVNTVGGGEPGGQGGQYILAGSYPQGYFGGTGGTGGYCRKTWARGSAGAPVPGTAYTLVAGSPGAGDPAGGANSAGAPGTTGFARLTWT